MNLKNKRKKKIKPLTPSAVNPGSTWSQAAAPYHVDGEGALVEGLGVVQPTAVAEELRQIVHPHRHQRVARSRGPGPRAPILAASLNVVYLNKRGRLNTYISSSLQV